MPAPMSCTWLLRLRLVTRPSLPSLGPRKVLSQAIWWQSESLPRPSGSGHRSNRRKGRYAGHSPFSRVGKGAGMGAGMGACSQARQPHSLQGPQLPYLWEPRGLVLCRQCVGGEGAHSLLLQNQLISGDASSFRQPELGAGVGWRPPH